MINDRMDEPEFLNNFLKKYNYSPYRCRVCGERFWSIVPREVCPDRPCSKYEFLLKKYPRVPKLTLEEARNKFINFFKKNDHGYMDPYPVLARWRNDLYLTIASIIVFQPAVTEGIVDPPYNPLVIVQPCIRLEDIDNVGYTFGRHLTSFEMGGHHAFNKPNKHVYWVDETLEYAYKFFSKELGIPEEDIVFKDSWWEGGGNAGPAYEVVVDGLELATLVFMKYKVVNGKYVPMDIKVVDTGYGIERIAWFTQRTPTAFHSIYGSLVDEYMDILSIEKPDYDVLKKIVYYLSDKDVASSEELSKYLSELGFSEYYDQMIKSIHLYTLLDHMKTLALMLSDGIVPSNTGEGYLARLVIRRILRTLYRLGFKVNEYRDIVLELMNRMIRYWIGKYVYGKFINNREYILDVLDYEVKKYTDTLSKGIRIVGKIIKKKSVGLDDLIRIYDSHGIPPEIVRDEARKYGVDIEVPKDFYAIVAKKHVQPEKLSKYKEEFLPRELVDWVARFSATRRLFHEDPYMYEFKGRVLGVKDRYIILDQTVFYPKSGGQDNDVGVIVLPNGEELRVVNVYKYGDVIVHELDHPVENKVKPHTIVKGVIDWRRRYRLMRHHTATHIILGAARRVLGDHVWQAGAEKTIEKGRLDITHYKNLSPDEVREIEELANKIVDDRIELKFKYMNKFDAEKKYGTRIYQGGAIVSKELRIVEIPGWDAEACFGTHLTNTGEVGGIKIVNVEKIQDGVIRLEYIAGTRLPEYSRELESVVEEASRELGVKAKQLIPGIRKYKRELNSYRELLENYRREFKQLVIKDIESSKDIICGNNIVLLVNSIGDEKLYRDIINYFVKKSYIVVYYSTRGLLELATSKEVVGKGVNLLNIVEKMKAMYSSVKGGGKPDHVTLRLGRIDSIEKVYSDIKSIISEMLDCVKK